jgi:hypothetical protein
VASLSPLETERFGVVIARARDVTADAVPTLLDFCEENGVELLIARCDGADQAAARALSSAGLMQLEAQITYRGPLVPDTETPGIREGAAEDADAVAELARTGFSDMAGHYHADPRLSPEDCRETYVDWSLRALAGEAADVFYVAEVDGRPAAFGFFAQTREEEVRFLLSTVAPWARGRGLYVAIMGRGMAWGSERGATALIGITPHGNIAAQRNLISVGLRPVSSTSTFHGWRDQLAAAR